MADKQNAINAIAAVVGANGNEAAAAAAVQNAAPVLCGRQYSHHCGSQPTVHSTSLCQAHYNVVAADGTDPSVIFPPQEAWGGMGVDRPKRGRNIEKCHFDLPKICMQQVHVGPCRGPASPFH